MDLYVYIISSVFIIHMFFLYIIMTNDTPTLELENNVGSYLPNSVEEIEPFIHHNNDQLENNIMNNIDYDYIP